MHAEVGDSLSPLWQGRSEGDYGMGELPSDEVEETGCVRVPSPLALLEAHHSFSLVFFFIFIFFIEL